MFFKHNRYWAKENDAFINKERPRVNEWTQYLPLDREGLDRSFSFFIQKKHLDIFLFGPAQE